MKSKRRTKKGRFDWIAFKSFKTIAGLFHGLNELNGLNDLNVS
jgi:hypothetical protein